MPRTPVRAAVAVRARTLPNRYALAALLAGLAATLLLPGCDRSPTDPEVGELAFQTLAKTSLDGVSGAPHVREIVRDRARFDALWRQLWGGRELGVPAIDFDRDMVIAVTASAQCFDDVTIERVALEPQGLAVDLTRPQPTLCLCGAIAYSTFHLVRVRRLDAEARYAERTVAPLC